MNLSNLKPAKGAVKQAKRIARGQGSGSGGTAGKGHKGARSRSGYKTKRGFEGGQMPLQRRIPKRGFKNFNRVEYAVINLAQLQAIADKHNITNFDYETFRALRIISQDEVLKVLANGELNSAITIEAHAFSEKARVAIEEKGGKVSTI
ncbi:MAG: 50S ribosomal protein L15 [Chitinophagales bacterium]|nr:50S ribosomal protein L15 [Chitinophagales bacterium]MCZ2392541.1 50S ribosomal protein L15 [Chitinophagales bacterium]